MLCQGLAHATGKNTIEVDRPDDDLRMINELKSVDVFIAHGNTVPVIVFIKQMAIASL
jgi:hypothetical protein